MTRSPCGFIGVIDALMPLGLSHLSWAVLVSLNWDVHLGFGQASSPDYDVFLHSSFII